MRAHQDRVYGFALYLLGRPSAAQDVTQEVLLKLWERLDTVDEARLVAWLMRVTRNACIDAHRRQRSYRRVVGVAPDDGLGQAPAADALPDAWAEAADFQARLRGALAALAEPYRSIVILREVQELTYEEISGAMDLPLNTVKVYLHRGRKKLRHHLSPEYCREAV